MCRYVRYAVDLVGFCFGLVSVGPYTDGYCVRTAPEGGLMLGRPIRRPFAAQGATVSRAVATACIAVLAVAGCSSQEPATRVDQPGQQITETPVQHEHASQAAEVNAVDLRAKLEQSLAQHAILTVRLTRARLRNDVDLAQTAEAALTKNTEDMGALVGSVYGPKAAEQFEKLWFSHVTSLFNYSRGVAENNADVTTQARAELADYTVNLSKFLEDATKQAAPASVVRAELQKHVDQLLQQTDAYAAGDYGRAFALERESYAHMFPLGKALATGIVTGHGTGIPAEYDSPAQQLRSRLGMLLGEHAELAVDAMRSGVTNSPDFPAAAAALDGNTGELTSAIESLFGGEGAAKFQTLWADHIDAFVGYTQGLATKDTAGKEAARARLQQFNADFAAFLSTSTQGRLAAPALADAFVMHEDLLIRQIDAYAERDYRAAHQVSYDAFQHMFVLAADAATAIGDTVAAQSPEGGAQTGGGTAAEPSAR
jgi:hypothetical protein